MTQIRLLAMVFLIVTLAFMSSLKVSGQLVGLVCFAPVSVGECPAPPVSVGAPVGSQLKVAVILQGSDPMSSFDITLKANSSILKPSDVDTTGSILSGGSVILKCIGSTLRQGTVCPSTDTIDTIHFVMTGPIGFISIAPTTGLLFTAIYNVTSSTSTTLGFQTGCSQSSVPGTSDCVVLANGTISPVQESVQNATYTQAATPTFAISSDTANIGVGKRTSSIVNVTITSVNGFSGQASLSATLSPSTKHPPSLSFSPSTVNMSPGGTATSRLTISEAANTTTGSYVITITCSSGVLSQSLQIQLDAIP